MAITLIPAYGRDYKSAKDAKADWVAGKNFIVCDMYNPYYGQPVNKVQVPGQIVKIRFAGQRKVCVINL